jgi:PDZ domain-containing protein
VDGVEVVTYDDMADIIALKAPGDDISLTVERNGQEQDVTFSLLDDGEGNAIMAIWVDPIFDIPVDVTVHIDKVGGPSAGLMFSLAIMDLLTPQDELAGQKVAGTGTIDVFGDAGPIGGIRMKMFGAVDAGAEFFLAPSDNCPDVRGNIPAGLSVVSVDTLDDAYEAIESIGAGETSNLPSC